MMIVRDSYVDNGWYIKIQLDFTHTQIYSSLCGLSLRVYQTTSIHHCMIMFLRLSNLRIGQMRLLGIQVLMEGSTSIQVNSIFFTNFGPKLSVRTQFNRMPNVCAHHICNLAI